MFTACYKLRRFNVNNGLAWPFRRIEFEDDFLHGYHHKTIFFSEQLWTLAIDLSRQINRWKWSFQCIVDHIASVCKTIENSALFEIVMNFLDFYLYWTNRYRDSWEFGKEKRKCKVWQQWVIISGIRKTVSSGKKETGENGKFGKVLSFGIEIRFDWFVINEIVRHLILTTH